MTAPAKQSWVGCAVLVLLVAIVYWPTASFDFVYDDEDYIVDHPRIRSVANLASRRGSRTENEPKGGLKMVGSQPGGSRLMPTVARGSHLGNVGSTVYARVTETL
jgi:hypothetical protein